jgi:hypothetical protein
MSPAATGGSFREGTGGEFVVRPLRLNSAWFTRFTQRSNVQASPVYCA